MDNSQESPWRLNSCEEQKGRDGEAEMKAEEMKKNELCRGDGDGRESRDSGGEI